MPFPKKVSPPSPGDPVDALHDTAHASHPGRSSNERAFIAAPTLEITCSIRLKVSI